MLIESRKIIVGETAKPFVVSSPFHGLRVVPCKLTAILVSKAKKLNRNLWDEAEISDNK